MRARVKRFHSPDLTIDPQPRDPRNFAFLLQAMVGPEGTDGEESFDIVVCTPAWLEGELSQGSGVDGRHHFIVSEFDRDAIEAELRARIESLEAPDWPRLAERIGRIGKWEFEDFEP